MEETKKETKKEIKKSKYGNLLEELWWNIRGNKEIVEHYKSVGYTTYSIELELKDKIICVEFYDIISTTHFTIYIDDINEDNENEIASIKKLTKKQVLKILPLIY